MRPPIMRPPIDLERFTECIGSDQPWSATAPITRHWSTPTEAHTALGLELLPPHEIGKCRHCGQTIRGTNGKPHRHLRERIRA